MEPLTFWRKDSILGARIVVVQEDDPALDCTDVAHPAWWRGEKYASGKWSQMVQDRDRRIEALKAENEDVLKAMRALQESVVDLEVVKHKLGLSEDAVKLYKHMAQTYKDNLQAVCDERDAIARDRDELEKIVSELPKEKQRTPTFVEQWKNIKPEYVDGLLEMHLNDWRTSG